MRSAAEIERAIGRIKADLEEALRHSAVDRAVNNMAVCLSVLDWVIGRRSSFDAVIQDYDEAEQILAAIQQKPGHG